MTETTHKKGGCLLSLLIFLITIYSLGGISVLIFGPMLSTIAPEYAAGRNVIIGILYLLNVVCLIGIWKLKRWGLYGYYAVTAATVIYTIMTGGEMVSTILYALIFPVLLYFVLKKSVWEHMK